MTSSSIESLSPQAGDLMNVVVETPGGSRNKFRYDEETGLFRLHKILPMGSAFPFDFGFVPGTRADDGDPLDVLVLGDEPTFTGCHVTVRAIGVLEARQTERGKTIRNDRLLGVPEGKKIRPHARSIRDLPGSLLDQIEHFFVAYNRYEGRDFRILRRSGPRTARTLLSRARRKFAATGGDQRS